MPATVAKRRQYPSELVIPAGNRFAVKVPFGDARMVIVEYRPPVAETRAAIDASISRMRADTSKGDAVKFLREFRESPRGR